jgi:hypothetical protein
MVMNNMLQSVPDHLKQMAISMQTLLDLDALSIEEVRVICRQWRTEGRTSWQCLHKMWVVNYCSLRSGWHAARHPPVRNLVSMVAKVAAMVAAEVTVVAIGMSEVEVMETRKLIHGKSGKKGAALMGHPRNAAFRCGKPSHFAWECRLKKTMD